MNYFKITGMDNGVEIEPYIIKVDSDYPVLVEYGDMVRHYDPVSKLEYGKYLTKVRLQKKLDRIQMNLEVLALKLKYGAN